MHVTTFVKDSTYGQVTVHLIIDEEIYCEISNSDSQRASPIGYLIAQHGHKSVY